METKSRIAILNNGKVMVAYGDESDLLGSIELTSSEMATIAQQYELNCAVEDVKSYISEHGINAEYTEADLQAIARRVIKSRDNCDGISETYWIIVDDTIKEFNKK